MWSDFVSFFFQKEKKRSTKNRFFCSWLADLFYLFGFFPFCFRSLCTCEYCWLQPTGIKLTDLPRFFPSFSSSSFFYFGGVFFFFLRIFSHLCCLFRTQLFFIIYTFSCWWCRMKHNGERWWTQTKTRTDIALFVLFQFIFFLVFCVDFASFVFPWHSFCVRWMECPAATRTNKAMMFQLERCSEPTLMPFLRHWQFPFVFFFFCAFFVPFFAHQSYIDWYRRAVSPIEHSSFLFSSLFLPLCFTFFFLLFSFLHFVFFTE